MLFNLSQQHHFPNTGYGKINCHSKEGPKYGYSELSAMNEPFNGDRKCFSGANNDDHKIPIEGGKNILTNQENGYFTITELEVWSIREI